MISVVIPAYNEERTISKCLSSLVAQVTNKKFEVILVDNNSTDKTSEIASKFKSKLDLKIVLEKEKGRGAARRAGCATARGEIILSTDADTTFPSNWVEGMSDALVKSGAVAINGTCRYDATNPVSETLYSVVSPISTVGYRMIFGHYWLAGFNSAIYKDVYERAGGYDSKLWAQEDLDLAFRVRKLGKIALTFKVPVFCSGRRLDKGFANGVLPYLTTFADYYWFKKNKLDLPDIRD